jgi:CheY-like chemotaxis protein
MEQRSILCIEPDAATVSEIRAAFQPLGFQVENIRNGDSAIEWATTNLPSLIILAVEPRKVGYAICNKLKRNPALQNTPLLLISSDETQATLDQHKKLRSHADGYFLKPLPMAEVLAIVERLVGAGTPAAQPINFDEEIELADDEIAEVSLDDDDGLVEESAEITVVPSATSGLDVAAYLNHANAASSPNSLQMLGDLSRPISLGPDVPSPFHDLAVAEPGLPGDLTGYDSAQFDRETQDAFAALEAGAGEGGGAGGATGGLHALPISPQDSELVNLRSLWDDEDLPEKMPWENPQPVMPAATTLHGVYAPLERSSAQDAADSAMIFGDPSPEVVAPEREATVPAHEVELVAAPDRSAAFAVPTLQAQGATDDVESIQLAHDVGDDVPPLPEEVIYDDRAAADFHQNEQKIAELLARVEVLNAATLHREGRTRELQSRIDALETERGVLRRELDEQRDRMTHAASQGAFSKERDLLSLREVINKKDKDILDLRDALDAKERQILDHKDKIRENERARRDLEERTLGFEKSLFLANEKAVELIQDRDKSIERERGLKARLDDAHEELRKSQDEIEALRKRVTQEVERGRTEVDKTRIELEGKLIEGRESHHAELSKANDEWNATQQAQQVATQAELARIESAHRVEVEALQRRLVDEAVMSAERLQAELSKLRRDHDKTITSMKDEQALQLASERQAHDAQTEAKQRAYRDEVISSRRRHEEELAAAEDRRQRDILEQEQRRVMELEQVEARRRSELQVRDEEHHTRVTEIERSHLIEKTETAERHRLEYDHAVGRAVRAEGELGARSQELEQAYRRLAGFEVDLDSARMELGDRDLKLTQNRDRLGELEQKLSDYEDQIVRAYQRLRADEKTGEKIRRALAVALALMDERGTPAQPALKSVVVAEEAEKS